MDRRRFVVLMLVLAATGGCRPEEQPESHQLALRYELASTCAEMTLSAQRDLLARPFVYVAAKSGGLRVYDVAAEPRLVTTVPSSALGSLDVMKVHQEGTLLFLTLGNSFGTDLQSPGAAIIDVEDPRRAAAVGLWRDQMLEGGAGAVTSAGDVAYVAAMGNGLVVLDVSSPASPRELTRLELDPTFPDPQPDLTKVNARGMFVAQDTLYVCNDAGGLRIIDVTDPARPIERGRYSNPALNGKPRAYNNVIVEGTIAYIGVDYCGLEVLDVSDPTAVKLMSWWNPWRCEADGLAWFSSDGHVNELALDAAARRLYVSAGKSDLLVLDVTEPTAPALVDEYGGTQNGLGTWGVTLTGDELLLTYVCAVIPFTSSGTGVRALGIRR